MWMDGGWMVDGCGWMDVDGWWMDVDGWWVDVDGWWMDVDGWWMDVDGWWMDVDGGWMEDGWRLFSGSPTGSFVLAHAKAGASSGRSLACLEESEGTLGSPKGSCRSALPDRTKQMDKREPPTRSGP